MTINVSIAGAREYRATRAIVLYEGSGLTRVDRHFATHAPAVVEENGSLKLGPFEPVTLEFMRSLASGLGVDLPREVLPDSVLCRTNDVVAWWTPPQIRTLFFGSDELQAQNGEDFPTPSLVWRLELGSGRLFIRAFIPGKAMRPSADTPLFVAPFLNVYEQGLVCQGSMRRPQRSGIETLQEWESGFFNASGSSQLTQRATTHPKQLVGLWKQLERKKSFPVRYLFQAGETLAQFLRREN